MKIAHLLVGCVIAVIVSSSFAAEAQRSKLDLIPAGKKLTAQDVAKLGTCRFTFKLKEGMTSSDANDAIEAALDRFVNCMKTNARKSKTPQSSG